MNSLCEIITDAAIDILESSAMIFAEALGNDADFECDDSTLVRATLEFKGPISGKIEIFASTEFASNIVASHLGVDLNSPEIAEFVGDSFGELANVLTGRVLADITETQGTFDLQHPEVVEVLYTDLISENQDQESIILESDEGSLLIRFYSEEFSLPVGESK